MFFSIIIPVYNVAQYLRDCLNSVVAQAYLNYEVICVNDGSTDESLSILEEYQRKYSQITIISQPNKGLSAARNGGIQAAKGDYIFFLDSDDWIEPDTLKILSEKQNGEDLVCFNGRRFFEDGTIEIPDKGITNNNLKGWDYYNKYSSRSRKFDFVCTVLRIYRRDLLLSNKLFFENGIYHEDNLFTPLVCYHAQSVLVIPEILYIYRIRKGSITDSTHIKQSKIKRIHDIVTVNNMLLAYFIPIPNIEKKYIYKNVIVNLMHLVNMINSWKLNDQLEMIYSEIDWINFKKTIRSLDFFILYKLLINKKLKLYYKLYYFDFYIFRKNFRKLYSLIMRY